MGADAQVVRYQRGAVARVLPPCAGVVPFGLWVAVIARTGETDAIPLVIALSALISFATWFASARTVAVTPHAIVMRSFRGTTTIAWTDIGALQRRWNTIWVMTADGWFALPLAGSTLPRHDRSDAKELGEEVWFAWLDRRGTDWTGEDLRPWRPNRDLRDRAVLRPPIHTRVGWLPVALFPLIATMIPSGAEYQAPLLERFVGAAMLFGFTAGAALAYHLWSRVTIDDHHIVVRSWPRGVIRIDRTQVIGIEEDTDRMAWNGRKLTRLALGIRQPVPDLPPPTTWRPTAVIRLVAPATADNWRDNDPAYHRTWAWLHDELVVRADTDVTTDLQPHVEP